LARKQFYLFFSGLKMTGYGNPDDYLESHCTSSSYIYEFLKNKQIGHDPHTIESENDNFADAQSERDRAHTIPLLQIFKTFLAK
jgi:hypothetical protein